MKIISWNVNSIRARIENFLKVIEIYQPDVCLLQETRVEDHIFPKRFIDDIGYNVAVFGEKSRNGVAIFSKFPLEDVRKDFCRDARYIEAFTNGIFIASIYVPNGAEVESDYYFYKLAFLEQLKERFKEYTNEIFIAGGDYNVAPFPDDTYFGAPYTGLCCTKRERDAIKKIRDLNFVDVLQDKGYTWWDYRANSFKKSRGFRIDQFYFSPPAQKLFLNGEVLKDIRAFERPSDHAPIMCEIL